MINQNTTVRIKNGNTVINSTSSFMISGHGSSASCFAMFPVSKGDIISYDAAASVESMETTRSVTWKHIPKN